ncbi:hypothetical protein BDY19DRAFT_993295 [Irpex rosettiformis]|uniref:Uncharacterized protein n=1 Tax=Irpex rosettiformis TaxID=378272 RepID=A0ACB8U3X1_9APHY|nr:hypothetical protein BDY19DRAFT_993295 [Irpex rosettiformis]
MARAATKPRIYHCIRKPCKKSFTTKGDMNRHVRYVHDGVTDGECHICGKRFGQRTVLKGHINTHTNEKPYKCPISGCGKSFGDQSSCTRHKREKHSGERYTCFFGRCTKTTKRRSEMSKHLQKKHGVRDSLERVVEETKQHVKQEIPESPLSDLTSLPDEDDEFINSHKLIRMTASPVSVPNIPLPPSPLREVPQEDIKPIYPNYDPRLDSELSAIYGPFLTYSTAAGVAYNGLQTFFCPPDVLYGDSVCYPSDYTYPTFDNHLSPLVASSLAESPLSLSPSPGPLLCEVPSLASTSTPDQELSYGYESLPAYADWSQPPSYF